MNLFTRVAALLLMTTTLTLAGNSLSIRLVEASNSGSGMDSSLNDVASALRAQLAFTSYKRMGAGSCPLPATGQRASLGGYSVTCSGPQNSLSIQITKGKQRLVNTTVNLKDGRPLLLGGFPSRDGKMMVVFVAR